LDRADRACGALSFLRIIVPPHETFLFYRGPLISEVISNISHDWSAATADPKA